MKLADLTTTAVGGDAARYVEATTERELIDAVTAADDAGDDVLLVAGGSNLVVDDAGFEGTVIRVATRGSSLEDLASCSGGMIAVEAGHDWDAFVAESLEGGFVGLEALSGIPGSAGATPVQNVGAYGTDVSHTIARVRTWDRVTRQTVSFANADLGFGYRDSILKRATANGSPRYVVLQVVFQLKQGTLGAPIGYGELAKAVGSDVGGRVAARQIRAAVLELRAGKGMVLDPEDRDTYSTGSFFTNPVVDESLAATLPEDAPRYPVATESGERVKLSAAWLIDRAGFGKGYGLEGTDGFPLAEGRAALSTKHTLAITNRGDATASDILAVARAVRAGVADKYGITLHNEPLLINCAL
ncbi:UDP-N-acetylmuramate dehydrogenase [Zhihengliuella salsuginis]|uniref:UDP-N-acetylenolpyruvoylglucosamine reductase n=1 Tax=Zhihengliuella salsuginis TaxID=578222 RepID=A0ABQ3GJ41_9MICC|nr:UDP-N-acetylmuramate dehydrogenase [Zhihengliuella salsuginis]GHD10045.1 UDP-N-acetylenolpyruvoylglucosamine reductase [Zhihengliuella salsuginis]